MLEHSCVDENHHLPQFGKWNQEGKKEGGNYSADFDLIGILDEIPFALLSFSKADYCISFDLLGELIIV